MQNRVVGCGLAVAVIVSIALAGCGSQSATSSPKPVQSVAGAKPTPGAKPTGSPTPVPDLSSIASTPRPLRTPPPRIIASPTGVAATPEPTAKISPTAKPTPTPTPNIPRTPMPAPSLTPGQTVSFGVGSTKLSFIFLSWFISDTAVAPLKDTFYTFKDKRGYRFVIVEYRYQNDYNEEQTTPDITAGEIFTQPKGYIYKLWVPPTVDADIAIYAAYPSGPNEIGKYGETTGGNVKLSQQYGARGRVVFDIPEDMVPSEVSLGGIKSHLILNDPSPSATVTPSSPLPPVSRGQTVAEMPETGTTHVSFTFLHWRSSDRAVVAAQGSHVTYFARPGMKFIVLSYRFKNNGATEQVTPDIDAGRIVTRPKGNAHMLWEVPKGTELKDYRPAETMIADVSVLGDGNGAGVRLVADQEVDGRVVFEIPVDAVPFDAVLALVPARLVLE